MKNVKRNRPATECWTIPDLTDASGDDVQFIHTYYALEHKKSKPTHKQLRKFN